MRIQVIRNRAGEFRLRSVCSETTQVLEEPLQSGDEVVATHDLDLTTLTDSVHIEDLVVMTYDGNEPVDYFRVLVRPSGEWVHTEVVKNPRM